MTQTAKPPPGETVVFVCPHGAGMSRLAAALFNQATEVAGAATVSINCTAPGAARWDLAATTIGEPMREELCRRTEQLAIQLRDGVPTPIANASPHLQEHPND